MGAGSGGRVGEPADGAGVAGGHDLVAGEVGVIIFQIRHLKQHGENPSGYTCRKNTLKMAKIGISLAYKEALLKKFF